jgi:type IV pilus assembly protein PilW
MPPPAPVRNSLMVRYATDTHISPVTKVTAGSSTIDVPTDCTGHRLAAPTGVFIADSRFHIDPGGNAAPPSLECRGNGVSPQSLALIDNVVALHVNYGVAAPDPDTAGKLLRVIRYVSASEVAEPGVTAEWDRLWSEVLAVRVCVVVRSAEEVLPSATAYMDCNQTAATPPDRRIYRAFTSTVLLNNRLSSKSLP